MSKGWIYLHRSILDWEWYDDPNTFRLFMHILLKANHTSKKWRSISIPRGSFLTSFDTLARELNLSVQNIRTCLSNLESTSEVTRCKKGKGQMITVTSYEEYQTINKESNKQLTGDQQGGNKEITSNQQQLSNDNTLKELKELKPKRDRKTKVFTPPTLEDVKAYFCKEGYSEESAIRFYNGYHVAEWKDTKGNKIKVWKQKAQQVWFKPEHKLGSSQGSIINL